MIMYFVTHMHYVKMKIITIFTRQQVEYFCPRLGCQDSDDWNMICG